MITKGHHFYMLNPRSFPIYISLMAFNLLFSFILITKIGIFIPFILRVSLTFCSAFVWWQNYEREFRILGLNSLRIERGLKFSIILFISSEIFFFFSFFWSYFHFLLSPTLEIGLNWPSTGLKIFDFQNVPLLNTIVLLGSGVSLTVSHYFIINSKKNLSDIFLFVTVILGIFFTILQALEYSRSFFSINDRTFGTAFFVLTGFHGIHVIIGTTYLFYVTLGRFFKPVIPVRRVKFEIASWYWHFVDVVWIFLYFFLYYINR